MKYLELGDIKGDLFVGVGLTTIGLYLLFQRKKVANKLLEYHLSFWGKFGIKNNTKTLNNILKIIVPLFGVIFSFCGLLLDYRVFYKLLIQ